MSQFLYNRLTVELTNFPTTKHRIIPMLLYKTSSTVKSHEKWRVSPCIAVRSSQCYKTSQMSTQWRRHQYCQKSAIYKTHLSPIVLIFFDDFINCVCVASTCVRACVHLYYRWINSRKNQLAPKYSLKVCIDADQYTVDPLKINCSLSSVFSISYIHFYYTIPCHIA